MTEQLRSTALSWLLSATAASAGAQAFDPAALPPPAVAAATATLGKVQINDISVSGNSLLAEVDIQAALASLRGLRTLEEMKAAAAAVQTLYRQAGYGAVVAYLPEQPLADGKLRIAVLEGRVARVAVVGNRQFSPDNVRRSLPLLVEGSTPLVRGIDAQVQLANDNPARKLTVMLEAGVKAGEVDVFVNVAEAPAERWLVFADNTGSQQTGRLRLGLWYQNTALFDRDHQLSLQVQTSPEQPSAVRVYSLNYRIPLYGAGLLLGAYATFSNVDAGSTATAAGTLQFNGRGRVLGTTLTRLLERAAEFDQRVTLALDTRDYLNNCSIEGLPAGACGASGESVSVQPLTLEYSARRTGDRPLALSASLSHNLALGGSHGSSADVEAVRPGARQRYTLARASAEGGLPITGNWRMNLRLGVQISADALVPGEQFGIAGASTVRGYEEREISGDSGLISSAEVLSPAVLGLMLRFAAFADLGQVHNRLGTFCDSRSNRCTLASAGLGMRYSAGPAQVKVDLAHALKDARSTGKGDTRMHFQASLALP